MPEKHVQNIIGAIRSCRSGETDRSELYYTDATSNEKNEYLFFTKPEIQDTEDNSLISARLRIVFSKFEEFSFLPAKILVLSGLHMGRHGIVQEHYGVIDGIARAPSTALSESARKEFYNQFGRSLETVEIVGGMEYLERHPELTPDRLSRIWLDGDYRKLAGGTYCLYLEDEKLYLFNGFYPRIIEHFTRSGATIVVMVLTGDVDWADARGRFIGSTDPTQARPGSLRHTFLHKKRELGIPEISPNLNGAHLSAGPVESLVELMRFTSDRDGSDSGVSPSSFSFGRKLAKRFSDDEIESILENPVVEWEGENISVFDLTEELNPKEALTRLAKVRRQFGSSPSA